MYMYLKHIHNIYITYIQCGMYNIYEESFRKIKKIVTFYLFHFLDYQINYEV